MFGNLMNLLKAPFLKDLNNISYKDRSVYGYLALSGIIGTLCTLFNYFLPWLPIVFVFALAILVILLYYKDYLLLKVKSDLVYFYGFYYTLISMLSLGINIPAREDIILYIPTAIQFLSAAITTTIVGIVARHIIFDYANTNIIAVKDVDYSKYLREIATAHKEFKTLYDDFYQLFRSSIDVRKKVLDEEIQNSEIYVKNLKVLCGNTLEILTDIFPKIHSSIDESAKQINEISKEVLNNYKIVNNDYLNYTNTALSESKMNLSYLTSEFEKESKNLVNKYSESLNQTAISTIQSYLEIAKTLSKDYNEKYSDDIKTLRTDVMNFKESITVLSTEFHSCKESLSQLEKQTITSQHAVEMYDQLVKKFGNKVVTIDEILDSYCEIITNKTNKISETF